MSRIERGIFPFSQKDLFKLRRTYTVYEHEKRALLVDNEDPSKIIEVSPSGVIYGNSPAELRKRPRKL